MGKLDGEVRFAVNVSFETLVLLLFVGDGRWEMEIGRCGKRADENPRQE